MREYILEDVFGIQRDIPLNYVTRKDVDDIFIESLSRNQHIVIYGSSKQGKTCLRKKCLPEENYIIVQCSNKLNIAQLNEQILKQAGFQITVSEKKSNSNTFKVNATGGFNFFAKAEASGEYAKEIVTETESNFFNLDLEDTNDMIKALKKINFSKFILLEDFHYLTKETQVDFSFSLKMYYDNSPIIFIIVGVWLEENRLIVYNGDLAGRLISINVDLWSDVDLKRVINDGTDLLNVDFNEDLVETILEKSFTNVYFVQEICYRICKNFKIKKTVPFDTKLEKGFYDVNGEYITPKESANRRFYVPEIFDVEEIIRQIVKHHSARYKSFISQFADENCNTKHELYKWILFPVLMAETKTLEDGLFSIEMVDIISTRHPQKDSLSKIKIMQSLKTCTEIQLRKNIRPNIIDYDESEEKLNIVDKGFIIWLEHQDKKELLNLIGLPLE